MKKRPSTSQRIAVLEKELRDLKKLNRTKREPVAGIGGVVQMHREAKGMMLQDLRKRSGLSAGLLSNIEQGKLPNPTWSTIRALAKGLGLTAAKLVEAFEAVTP
jgi:ribosome-binding protein aMBF1 (putative translation factor)